MKQQYLDVNFRRDALVKTALAFKEPKEATQ